MPTAPAIIMHATRVQYAPSLGTAAARASSLHVIAPPRSAEYAIQTPMKRQELTRFFLPGSSLTAAFLPTATRFFLSGHVSLLCPDL